MKLKNNIIGSWFIIIAIFSLFLGLVFGILGGLQHLYPNLLKDTLSFQKMRPLHTYLSINWIFTAATGIIYYYLPEVSGRKIYSEKLDSWNLLPKHPDWSTGIHDYWKVGEKAAAERLTHFVKYSINDYEKGRDIPSMDSTSFLSPYLHFGEISPRQIYQHVKNHPKKDKFLSELGWREFSHYQLYHYPELPEQPWQKEFARFPWGTTDDFLKRWQKGETGYPIVDAGMRELNTTGYMHNRVRMITASFLIKHLQIDWKWGEAYFAEKLMDFDLALNNGNWQWVAGTGVDASPSFRVFNPYLQQEKFDKHFKYIKKWIPEFNTSSYPKPMVEHETARNEYLAKLKKK